MRTKWLLATIAILLLISVSWADSWDARFNEQILRATLQLAPSGLRDKISGDDMAIRAAVRKASVINRNGKRDPDEHYAALVQILKSQDASRARILNELAAFVLSAIDRTAPKLSYALSRQVGLSKAIAKVHFDGYHRVTQWKPVMDLLVSTAQPLSQEITQIGAREEASGYERAADNVAKLFNLYVNFAADCWFTAARDAEIELSDTAEPGQELNLAEADLSMGVFTPSADVNIDEPLHAMTAQALGRQLLVAGQLDDTQTAEDSNQDDDVLVFDEGVTISGDQAQQGAQQLANSDMRVEGGDVNRVEGLDEEALAALRDLGIDVNTARRPFRGTRGGVTPGQSIRLGDVDFDLGRLSTVEIESRAQRDVYMQLTDSALGISGASGGHLNQKVVATVIQANVGAFKTCFERRLRDVPDLAGRVFIQFTITDTGEVTGVQILENTTGDEVFSQCLIRQVQRLRFPKPRGGEVSFIFPFIFEQAF